MPWGSSTCLPEEVLRLAMHDLRGLSWCGQAANLGQQAWTWPHAAQFLWALLQKRPALLLANRMLSLRSSCLATSPPKSARIKAVPVARLTPSCYSCFFEMLVMQFMLQYCCWSPSTQQSAELMKQECGRSLPHPWMLGRPCAERASWPGTQTCAPSAP